MFIFTSFDLRVPQSGPSPFPRLFYSRGTCDTEATIHCTIAAAQFVAGPASSPSPSNSQQGQPHGCCCCRTMSYHLGTPVLIALGCAAALLSHGVLPSPACYQLLTPAQRHTVCKIDDDAQTCIATYMGPCLIQKSKWLTLVSRFDHE